MIKPDFLGIDITVTLLLYRKESVKILFFAFVAICFSTVSFARSYDEAVERIRFFSYALNVFKTNQAPLYKIKNALSAEDKKAFDLIASDVNFMNLFKTIVVGDQVHFYDNNGFFKVSLSIDTNSENTLLINGWTKRSYDPNNIYKSFVQAQDKYSFLNLFVHYAQAKNLADFDYDSILFLLASADKSKNIPNINLKDEKDIKFSQFAAIFNSNCKITTPTLLSGEDSKDHGAKTSTLMMNSMIKCAPAKSRGQDNLEITCNQGSRAKVKFKEGNLGDELELEDKGDFVTISRPKHVGNLLIYGDYKTRTVDVFFKIEKIEEHPFQAKFSTCIKENTTCILKDRRGQNHFACEMQANEPTKAQRFINSLPSMDAKTALAKFDSFRGQPVVWKTANGWTDPAKANLPDYDTFLNTIAYKCTQQSLDKYTLKPFFKSGDKLTPATENEIRAQLDRYPNEPSSDRMLASIYHGYPSLERGLSLLRAFSRCCGDWQCKLRIKAWGLDIKSNPIPIKTSKEKPPLK